MDRYATGNEGAFADLYEALAPDLYRFLRDRVSSDAEADQALADTLLHLHRHRGSFISGRSVLVWAQAVGARLLGRRDR